MKDFSKTLAIIAQVIAYLIAIIIIFEILRKIFGGSWSMEEIILGLVIFNLTVSFGIGGYLIHLNNKISSVNTKIENHQHWHKGLINGKKEKKRK